VIQRLGAQWLLARCAKYGDGLLKAIKGEHQPSSVISGHSILEIWRSDCASPQSYILHVLLWDEGVCKRRANAIS